MPHNAPPSRAARPSSVLPDIVRVANKNPLEDDPTYFDHFEQHEILAWQFFHHQTGLSAFQNVFELAHMDDIDYVPCSDLDRATILEKAIEEVQSLVQAVKDAAEPVAKDYDALRSATRPLYACACCGIRGDDTKGPYVRFPLSQLGVLRFNGSDADNAKAARIDRARMHADPVSGIPYSEVFSYWCHYECTHPACSPAGIAVPDIVAPSAFVSRGPETTPSSVSIDVNSAHLLGHGSVPTANREVEDALQFTASYLVSNNLVWPLLLLAIVFGYDLLRQVTADFKAAATYLAANISATPLPNLLGTFVVFLLLVKGVFLGRDAAAFLFFPDEHANAKLPKYYDPNL